MGTFKYRVPQEDTSKAEVQSDWCEQETPRPAAEEIRRDFDALQERLQREFSDRRAAWRPHQGPQAGNAKPAANAIASEDRLPPEFRKKLQEWQRIKSCGNQTRQPPPIPDRSELSEEFLKKWDEWKRLKEVRTWGESAQQPSATAPPIIPRLKNTRQNEVVVPTSTGLFRFEGISRSFTRKLHEWEKAMGIAPEASTSALLMAARTESVPATLPLQRSHSVGSVAGQAIPLPTSGRPSHASSLSLNDADELKNVDMHTADNHGSSSGIDAEADMDLDHDSDSESPGAVLVEVEALEVETAAPLVAVSPRAERQTPVYKYDNAVEIGGLICEKAECTTTPSIGTSAVPAMPPEMVSKLRSEVLTLLKEEVAYQQLCKGFANICERRNDVSKQLTELKDKLSSRSIYGQTSGRLKELEKRFTRLTKEGDILENSLKERAKEFDSSAKNLKILSMDYMPKNIEQSFFVEILNTIIEKDETLISNSDKRLKLVNEGNYKSDDFSESIKNMLRDIEKIESSLKKNNTDSNNIFNSAYNSRYSDAKIGKNQESVNKNSPKTFHCVLSDKDVKKSGELLVDNIKAESENSQTRSTEIGKKDYSDRASSSNSKRKTKARQRLERELSRHADTDSEETVDTVTIEIPKRKKLVRTRRISETHKQSSLDKPTDSSESNDNVQYTLRLKTRRSELQNNKQNSFEKDFTTTISEVQVEDYFDSKSSRDPLISPEEIRIQTEVIEMRAENEYASTPEVLIKTTRKIFSPVRRDSKGKTKAVIGFDLEEITSSIEKRRSENNNLSNSQTNVPESVDKEDGMIKTKLSNESISKIIKSHESRIPEKSSSSNSLSASLGMTPSPSHQRRPFIPLEKSESKRIIPEDSFSKDISLAREVAESSIIRNTGDRSMFGSKLLKKSPSANGSPILSRPSTPAASSLPPLPSSPIACRREKQAKETAPSIRIMIQKYNMRLNEDGGHPNIDQTSPVASTGSLSPVAWRSPTSERRVRQHAEKYQDEVRRILQQGTVRNNPFFDREVQKSASAGVITKSTHDSPLSKLRFYKKDPSPNVSKDNISDTGAEPTSPIQKRLLRGILSSSAGSLKCSPLGERKFSKTEPKIKFNMNQQTAPTNLPSKLVENKPLLSLCSKSSSLNEEKKNIIKTMAYGIRRKFSGDSPKCSKSEPATPMGNAKDDPLEVIQRNSLERALRLKEARERFLNSSIDAATHRKRGSNSDLNSRNRLSQISCGSDTSYENADSTLAKSASVGMINLHKEAFEQLRGYESLPRAQNECKLKPSKFSFSNLASKFRKVKMRKNKGNAIKTTEKDKSLNTVSRLCRQSLLVNLEGGVINKEVSDPVPSTSSQSRTDLSVLEAGKTGGAVAVGGSKLDEARSISRSISMPDNSNKLNKKPKKK